MPPRKGSLLVIFLTVFVDLLGFGIVLPLLPIYGKHFAEARGFSEWQTGLTVGLLMAIFSLMQFLFVPFWGRLSDQYGRRPILLIGLAGSTVFYALFGVATVWRSIVWLFVARMGAGIAGATIATAQAYIADVTPREERTKGMALIGAAFALSFTLGPLFGAVSILTGDSAEFSPRPGYFAAGLSAIALLLAIFLLPESLHQRHQERRSLFNMQALRLALQTPTVPWLLLSSFIAVLSFTNFEATLSLQIERIFLELQGTDGPTPPLLDQLITWGRQWGLQEPAEIKLFVVFVTFGFLGIVLTLAQGFLVRRLAGRLSERVMATCGGILSILGFAMLAVAVTGNRLNLLYLAMGVEVVGFALITPSLQSLISRRTSPSCQGQVLGVGQSLSAMARILGPVIGVLLFGVRPALPYATAIGVMVLGLGLILYASSRGGDWEEEPEVAGNGERPSAGLADMPSPGNRT